jgi:hypothetical protein
VSDPIRVVDALLGVPEVFGADLPALDWFRGELVSVVGDLLVAQ